MLIKLININNTRPPYLMLFPAKADQKKGTDLIAVGFSSIFRAATLPGLKKQKYNNKAEFYDITCLIQSLCCDTVINLWITVSVGHLPMTDVDPLVVANVKREGSNVSGTENIDDVGLHEL